MDSKDLEKFPPDLKPMFSRKEKSKRTFWCKVCSISLNSEDTKRSHELGVKHMKNVLARDNEDSGDQSENIVQVENPPPTRKKMPVRLQQKLHDSSHPIVGLNYVREFIAESDPEQEPHYECSLCSKMGQANGMMQHLIGRDHRVNFAIQEFERRGYGSKDSDLKPAALLRLAIECDEKVTGFEDRITTTVSDQDFPAWQAGKEPWLVENGGDGVAPATRSRTAPPKRLKLERESGNEDTIALPSVECVTDPVSLADCRRMAELGSRLVTLASQHPTRRLSDHANTALRTILAAIAAKIGNDDQNQNYTRPRQEVMEVEDRKHDTRQMETQIRSSKVGNMLIDNRKN